MIKAENFIYFITVCGFFIGLVFSILSHSNPIYVVWSTIAITIIFYIISLAVSGYFIKNSAIKPSYSLKSEFYDIQLNKAISQIQRRERFLRDAQRYIEDLETELYSESPDLDLPIKEKDIKDEDY
ncbi:MAG: hypothetical protein ACTTIC_07695 [Helicobacteraceae bacterium]